MGEKLLRKGLTLFISLLFFTLIVPCNFSEAADGRVIVIDGMNFFAIGSLTGDSGTGYLYAAIESSNRELITDKIGPIQPFYWSNDPFWHEINEVTVHSLTDILRSAYTHTKATNAPLIIVAHSWGTVLAYVALEQNPDIIVDKLVTLGSPLETITPVIKDKTNYELMRCGAFPIHALPNVIVWHNYWILCDLFSGSISAALNHMFDVSALDDGLCHRAYYKKDSTEWGSILTDVLNTEFPLAIKYDPIPLSIEYPYSAPVEFTFHATGSLTSDANATYSWDFKDGTPESGKDKTHYYKQPGEYNVTLTMTDSFNTSHVKTESVAVRPPKIDMTYPNGLESLHRHFSTPSNLHVPDSGHYHWNYGDGSPSETGEDVGHTYPTSGSYNVTLTLMLDDGTQVSNTVQIFVGPGTRYIQGHTIYYDETWYSGGIYMVQGSIYVSKGATLTIEPGTIIKFQNAGLSVDGTLKANGSSGNPIVFTSYQDDSYGGDTNGDGNATMPTKGDWGNISFGNTSKNSILNHVIVKYAGKSPGCYGCAPNIVPAIDVQTSSIILSNSTISDNFSKGIHVYSGTPSIQGNTITNNGQAAIYLSTESAGTVVRGNTASGNGSPSTTGWNGVLIEGGLLSPNVTLTNNLPYGFVTGYPFGSPTVAEGAVLAVEPGAIIKLGGSSLGINGTLIADGTSDNPVIFTSTKDDSYGGDTNGDGNATMPTKGDWGNISFGNTSKNSILNHVILKYAGSVGGYYPATPALYISTSSLSVSNSLISDNFSSGLKAYSSSPRITSTTFIYNQDGISVDGENANPVITDCIIKENAGYGINVVNTQLQINATNNSYGDPSGPLDDSDDRAIGGLYNPNGKGNRVSDKVNYYPWVGVTAVEIEKPANFSATPENGAINLSWTSSSNTNISGYKVYYGTSAGSYGTPKIIGIASEGSSLFHVGSLNSSLPPMR